MDEVTIYNRVLTPIDILGIYNAGSSGKCLLGFVNMPQNQIVALGDMAIFTASLTGEQPIALQWQHSGVNIPDATNAPLTVQASQFANAGVYTIVASSAAGSTSASALLTIVVKLGISPGAGNTAVFNWAGPYVLQTGTNVTGPYVDVPGANSPFTNLISNDPQRYFRLRSNVTNSLTAANFPATGQFDFNISGVPGYNYMILASTNLHDWTPFQTNTPPFSFLDTNAQLFSSRFYRTLLVH